MVAMNKQYLEKLYSTTVSCKLQLDNRRRAKLKAAGEKQGHQYSFI